MTEAVEKVAGILLERNNRIVGVGFLNRTCAFDPRSESMLRIDPAKIFFDSIAPFFDSATRSCGRSEAVFPRARRIVAQGRVGSARRTVRPAPAAQ
jgi:hypothetical protein